MGRAETRALARATARTRAAGGDPAVAAELEQLRALRTATYALIHVLVRRLGGGPLEIPRGDWRALPPGERLKVQLDPDTDDVRLWIARVGVQPEPAVDAAIDAALGAGAAVDGPEKKDRI